MKACHAERSEASRNGRSDFPPQSIAIAMARSLAFAWDDKDFERAQCGVATREKPLQVSAPRVSSLENRRKPGNINFALLCSFEAHTTISVFK
jgi:hypothetical protein